MLAESRRSLGSRGRLPSPSLRRMNSVALITGGSRGIGRGIALELAKIGYDLLINYVSNVAAARQTAADCIAAARTAGKTIRAEICQADIGSSPERRKLIEFTHQIGRAS